MFKKIFGQKKKVGLYFWSPNDHRGEENFGDYLSKLIVKKLVNKYYEDLSKTIKYSTDGVEKRLLAIGSILHHAKNDDTIWGSGINGKLLGQKIEVSTLDVRMVRGPLTRELLVQNNISCPKRYGEPGLLVSNFFGEIDVEKKYPFSLILNLNDIRLYDDKEYIVHPTEDLSSVIRRIRESEMIVSTSLHGLVIAEAFGVPARHLLSFAEPTFKYVDYYRGTGRFGVQFAHTLEEALDLGGVSLPQLDPQSMINCFPSDILREYLST
jgi:pyruvyltransferase